MFWISVVTIQLILCSSSAWSHHHNNTELYQYLKRINDKCPSITHLHKLSFQGVDTTVKGNHLWVLILGRNPREHVPGVPEFKYVANMHGNEVVGRELLLYYASELCEGFIQKSRPIMWMLEHTRIHLMPSMNPDGYEIAQGPEKHNILGRKNANNVDLNRNFPDLDPIAFKNSRRSGALDHLLTIDNLTKNKLEIETWLVINWIMTNPFVLSANLHGGDLVANYPYDTTLDRTGKYSASPDDVLFKDLALSYSTHNERMFTGTKVCQESQFTAGITNGADWYPLNGGMQDFNYLASNCYEITLELGCEKYPDGSQLPRYWEENRRSLSEYLMRVHSGVKGMVYVFDLGKKDIVPIENAKIAVTQNVDSETFKPILHNVWSNTDGDYYRLLPKGVFAVVVDFEGYKSALACVRIDHQPGLGNQHEAQVFNFVLTKGKLRHRDALRMIEAKGHDPKTLRMSDGLDDEMCTELSRFTA